VVALGVDMGRNGNATAQGHKRKARLSQAVPTKQHTQYVLRADGPNQGIY